MFVVSMAWEWSLYSRGSWNGICVLVGFKKDFVCADAFYLNSCYLFKPGGVSMCFRLVML